MTDLNTEKYKRQAENAEKQARIEEYQSIHDSVNAQIAEADARLLSKITAQLRLLESTGSTNISIQEEITSKTAGLERKTTLSIEELK